MTQPGDLQPNSLAAPDARPLLFYQAWCPRCRVLSRLAELLSLQTIRRMPIDSRQAELIRSRSPDWRGELLLAEGERIWRGRAALLALLFVTRREVSKRLASRLGRLSQLSRRREQR